MKNCKASLSKYRLYVRPTQKEEEPMKEPTEEEPTEEDPTKEEDVAQAEEEEVANAEEEAAGSIKKGKQR